MRNDDWMGIVNLSNYSARPPQFEWYGCEGGQAVGGPNYNAEPRRIFIDKTAYRIRFEGETESSVILVIEPKEEAK